MIDGMIYVHLRNQRFACIDPADGASSVNEAIWEVLEYVVNGRECFVLDERGDLMLLEASADEYKQIDLRHVSDTNRGRSVGASAVAETRWFVRHLYGLTVYRWVQRGIRRNWGIQRYRP